MNITKSQSVSIILVGVILLSITYLGIPSQPCLAAITTPPPHSNQISSSSSAGDLTFVYYLPVILKYTKPTTVLLSIQDETNYELLSHLDIINWSMDNEYKNVLRLRDLPMYMEVDREGVELYHTEYQWEITMYPKGRGPFSVRLLWGKVTNTPRPYPIQQFMCERVENGWYTHFPCDVDIDTNTISFKADTFDKIETITSTSQISITTYDALYPGDTAP